MRPGSEDWIKTTDFRGLRPKDLPVVAGAAWVPLKRSGFTLVDASDVVVLSTRKLTWLTGGGDRRKRKEKPYAAEGLKRVHRILTNAPKKTQVDHINANSLDNRRQNLQIVNGQSEQECNKTKRGGTSSQYLGVSKGHGGWVASIYLSLGTFDTLRRARRVAAKVDGAKIRKRSDLHSRPYQVYVSRSQTFTNERDAALKHDQWAWEHWHSLKPLNFPDQVQLAA